MCGKPLKLMKKVLIVLLVVCAHNAFAQKNLADVEFQKIDSTIAKSGKTWFERNFVRMWMEFYPCPDSVANQGKNTTMYFFDQNLKATVSAKFFEKYLTISARPILVKIRVGMRLNQIRQQERTLGNAPEGPSQYQPDTHRDGTPFRFSF